MHSPRFVWRPRLNTLPALDIARDTYSIHRMLLMAVILACLFAPPASAETSPDLMPLERPAGDGVFVCKVGDLFVRTELFFGRSKPDGSTVTDREFQRFLNREITPRFPEGLTVLEGRGQFRDSSGVILREDAVLLILLYPATEEFRHQRIERIREEYKSAFQQESVLRVDSSSCVSF
jgi:hypothetical protein